jgi:radical SAM superfamily enzyme YgiQ (UPF0313 family)
VTIKISSLLIKCKEYNKNLKVIFNNMKRSKVLVLNPFLRKRFSKDGRCQTQEEAWLDTFPPVMLPSIAGMTREKYETKLLDCVGLKKPLSYFLPQIENFSPDLTVINTSTSSLEEDLEAGRIVKEITDSKIAVYGEYVTFKYKEILKKFPFIDYVIRGEPETPTFRILEGETTHDGIASRNHTGDIWREPNLDDLPFPAYDLMPTYRFPLTGEKWIFIRSGRGCPYQCIFCIVPQFYGNIPRFHSIDYMIRQIRWIVEKLKIRLGMMWDDTHTLYKERVIELSKRLIESGLNKKFKYFCTTRADRLDEEVIKYLKLSGCQMIALGIESGCQEILNNSKKNLRINDIKKAVRVAKKYGIATIGHFILGLPGSNIEKDKISIKFANDIKIDFAQFYAATPFEGSELKNIAVRNNWIIRDYGNVQQNAIISYPHYTNKQINLIRKKAFKNFYLNFSRLRSLNSYLKLLKNPVNIFRVSKKISSFLKWGFI